MNLLAPKPLLHAEGLAVLIGATLAYRHLHASWLLFALLFFAPDLFMLGYVVGAKPGAWLYNLGHTYLAPALLLVLALGCRLPWLLAWGIIWIAHIGFDRMLGYGLKYEAGFKSTHLGKV